MPVKKIETVFDTCYKIAFLGYRLGNRINEKKIKVGKNIVCIVFSVKCFHNT